MPRGVKGVLVTLADGTVAVVPARYPDRLAAALRVDPAAPKVESIRAATDADLDAIEEIDERAEAIFRVAGYDLPPIAFQRDELAEAKAVFVFGDPPVGYAWVDEVDGLAHLHELAVIPKRMRQGIGTQLLERACEWATRTALPGDHPHHLRRRPVERPVLRARGFTEITELTPGLAGLRIREQEPRTGRRRPPHRDATRTGLSGGALSSPGRRRRP